MNIMKVEEIEAWAESQGYQDVVKLCQDYALLETENVKLRDEHTEMAGIATTAVLLGLRSRRPYYMIIPPP